MLLLLLCMITLAESIASKDKPQDYKEIISSIFTSRYLTLEC